MIRTIMIMMTNLASAASHKETVFSSVENFSTERSLATWQPRYLSVVKSYFLEKEKPHFHPTAVLQDEERSWTFLSEISDEISMKIGISDEMKIEHLRVCFPNAFTRGCVGNYKEAGSLLMS